MSQTNDEWIEATGGCSADPLEHLVRSRIQVLLKKLRETGLSEAEHAEYMRLMDSLPDPDDDDSTYSPDE